ncbi:abortive phage infection protein [Lysinibacillus sp. CTST325]
MENYENMLKQLQNGELKSIEIEKDQFYEFREVLVKHPLFKHFRGEAKQNGRVIYTYQEVARS